MSAQELAQFIPTPLDEEGWEWTVPEGYRFVGAGAYRVCYERDGWVYKFDQGETASNEMEWAMYQALQDRHVDGVRLPETRFEHGLIVMEYVKGQTPPPCYYGDCECGWDVCWTEKLTELGLVDVSSYNAKIQGDVVVPIDLEC